jgi:GH43 family beta-xylosidase
MKFKILSLRFLIVFSFVFNLQYLSGNPHPLYFGDPYILRDGDTYYMYGTSSDDGFEVFRSDDLIHWEGPMGNKNGLVLHKDDVYGEKWFWAPEVYKIGSKYYMYYSAEEHIAVAVSDSPLGPFKQDSKVPLFETKAIDTHLYIDGNGRKYLYYVAFTNGNVIWMCELNDDLISVKPNTVKECFGRSQPWEFSTKEPVGVVNEGPYILKKGKIYYMVYSANHYASPDYGIGYATSSSPGGPWKKYEGNPIYQSPDSLTGVGHCSFFTDKAGNLQMVYHAHFNKQKVHPRKVLINPVTFEKKRKVKAPVLKVSQARTVPLTNAYFTNPVFDGADPWVIRQDSFYFWCSSSGNGIEVSRSRFLTEKGENRKVWSSPDTGWNRKHIWAPELHYLDGKWYIYYAAGYDGPPFIHQKSGVLESVTSDPLGEYADRGLLQTGADPFNPDDNVWAIDMTVFRYKNQLYGVWSGWVKPETTDKTPQHIYIAPMSNPYTISGYRTEISKPEESWETGGPLDLNEGPEVLQTDSSVFIIYSCRESWLKEYRLAQLRLVHRDSSLLNPKNWIKTGPVFQGTDKVLGVGHASFTISPDGREHWIIYHSKKTAEPGWERDVRLQKFKWNTDGNPDFGTPIPAGEPLLRPSGETMVPGVRDTGWKHTNTK